jgi:hypothetical protein
LTPQIDTTVWGAVGGAFNSSSTLAVDVDGLGTFTPQEIKNPTWAEYGGRVGYKIWPNATIDAFADGVSGGNGIGTNVNVGADFRYSF